MRLSELQNNQVVRYRKGLHFDTPHGDRTEWEEWREGPLYVQRHPRTNKILIITPLDDGEAEFSPEDFQGQSALNEGYLLEIDGLEQLDEPAP